MKTYDLAKNALMIWRQGDNTGKGFWVKRLDAEGALRLKDQEIRDLENERDEQKARADRWTKIAKDLDTVANTANERVAELEERGKRSNEVAAKSLTQAAMVLRRKEDEINELHKLIASMTPRVPHGDGLRDEVEAAFRVMDPGTPCSVSLTARCAQLVDERDEAVETNEALRESLQRCLDTMAKFDSTNYDDHGGPHLADGIQKLGQKAARRDILRGEVTGD